MKKLQESYEKLYNDCTDQNYKCGGKTLGFDELSHFVGVYGRRYRTDRERIFVIGRAVNGWATFETTSASSFAEEAVSRFDRQGFSWLKMKDGKLVTEDESYSLSSSPFWRVSKQIWEGVTGKSDDFWVDHIAWTNLYKVAPKESGDPTNTMCKKQSSACFDILQCEMNLLNPTVIIIISGWDSWFYNEKDYYDFSHLFINLNKETDNCVVEGTAEFVTKFGRKVPVIVTSRPEGKDEKDFSQKVIERIELFKKNSNQRFNKESNDSTKSKDNNGQQRERTVNININGSAEDVFAQFDNIFAQAFGHENKKGSSDSAQNEYSNGGDYRNQAIKEAEHIMATFTNNPDFSTAKTVQYKIRDLVSKYDSYKEDIVSVVDREIMNLWNNIIMKEYVDKWKCYPESNQFPEFMNKGNQCWHLIDDVLKTCPKSAKYTVYYKHILDIMQEVYDAKGYIKKKGLFGKVTYIPDVEMNASLRSEYDDYMASFHKIISNYEKNDYYPHSKAPNPYVKPSGNKKSILDNPVVGATASYAMGKSVVDASKKSKSYQNMAENPNASRYKKAQDNANANKLSNQVKANKKCCATCVYWDGNRTTQGRGANKYVQLSSSTQTGKCGKQRNINKTSNNSCSYWEGI